ncbi:MAG: type VI secretion system baseplate subunit TssK [Desulfobacterales bacterium]|nr:type VI secretion system baseplate subunit TssK [Desulfobacterales bacterium]
MLAKVEALYGFHREPTKNVIEFSFRRHCLVLASAYGQQCLRDADPPIPPPRYITGEAVSRTCCASPVGWMTFSKGYSLNDLPGYDHLLPGPCFLRIDQILRDLLDTVISTRYFRNLPDPAQTVVLCRAPRFRKNRQ